ncbi:InlB B-repeat-containing protein, partial [Delftia sp. S66]|uniref:InlB B-repeat-containing protein n=1 Tax=Delftia sp. S66 TaxID=2767437 RepID=UPI002D7F8F39
MSASFVLNTYSIGIVPAPANGTVTCAPNPVNHGQGASCTATPYTGYHFTSWSGDCAGTGA